MFSFGIFVGVFTDWSWFAAAATASHAMYYGTEVQRLLTAEEYLTFDIYILLQCFRQYFIVLQYFFLSIQGVHKRRITISR